MWNKMDIFGFGKKASKHCNQQIEHLKKEQSVQQQNA